jgi:hypothetical protein
MSIPIIPQQIPMSGVTLSPPVETGGMRQYGITQALPRNRIVPPAINAIATDTGSRRSGIIIGSNRDHFSASEPAISSLISFVMFACRVRL